MTHLVIVILHDLTRLPALLDAWKRIGVPGVTLMHSVGGFEAEGWLSKIGLGGLGRLFEPEEIRQRTLFSVIRDQELLERAIAEADKVVEGFDRPNSGILFTLPVEHALGIRKRGQPNLRPVDPELEEFDAESLAFHKKMPVSEVLSLLNLEPITVNIDASIQEMINAILARPNVQVVCVINDELRLMGLINVEALADAFFFSIFPEEFLIELNDLEKALDLAHRTHTHVAGDIMKAPVWVKKTDPLDRAFHLMHEHKLAGLPVVDDRYQIVGYINLLEMMAAFVHGLTK